MVVRIKVLFAKSQPTFLNKQFAKWRDPLFVLAGDFNAVLWNDTNSGRNCLFKKFTFAIYVQKNVTQEYKVPYDYICILGICRACCFSFFMSNW